MFKDQLQAELDLYYEYGGSDFVRYTHRLRIDRIKKLISNVSSQATNPNDLKALDAGCSYGVYSLFLAEEGYEVSAIDINDEELKKANEWARARGLTKTISFEHGDIQAINQENSTFDLIVCSEVLEHLDHPDRGAGELFRVLKPNGKAIISMPNMGSLYGLLQWTYRKSGIRTALGRPPLDQFQLQHSRYWFGNILKILKGSGFAIEHTYSTSHVPYLWKVDAILNDQAKSQTLLCDFESILGTLPVFQYLGYNLVVVARKPASNASVHFAGHANRA